jgi:DNA-binding transcriptional ArsR family regulator
VDQAAALLKPARLEVLRRLDAPRTCPELAEMFGGSTQRVYYHVKALEKAGLVEKVAERRVRGAREGVYQARARSYALAPGLVSGLGGRRQAQDQTSLRVLLSLAEEVQDDIGRLARRSEAGEAIPSLSLSAHIYLPDAARRAGFMQAVQAAVQDLARQYGLPPDEGPSAPGGAAFRLILACYPDEEKDNS